MNGRSALSRSCAMVVRLYPTWWRNHYGEEVSDVLDACQVTWATLADLARGALDARLHSFGDPRRSPMDDVCRRSTTVLNSFAAFCLVGAGLAKLGEDKPVHASLARGLTAWTWRGVILAAVVAVGFALVACLAFAVALLRPEGRAGLRRTLPMAGLATASLVAMPAAVVAYARLFGGSGTRSGAGAWLSVLGMGALVATLLTVALLAATTAVRRADVPPAQARLAARATIAAPVAMAVCTAAAVAWGLALRSHAPTAFSGSNGIASSSLVASWVAIVAAMIGCTLTAARAAVGNLRVLRARTA
jgi:hypothetical protein